MVVTYSRRALSSTTLTIVLACAIAAEAQTTRVSVATGGSQGDAASADGVMSGDGRFVTFWSGARNLVADDTNGHPDVFVHDRHTGDTTRVSLTPDGSQFHFGAALPAISADGRFVAFSSGGSSTNVFLHDRLFGDTVRLSNNHNAAGQAAAGNSQRPSLSADAALVVFESDAWDLVSNDLNGQTDIFVTEAATGKTTLVSVASDGTQANGGSHHARISADGRFVVFISEASNLVAGDTNDRADVFIHERQTGRTARVNVAGENIQANAAGEHPAVSANGRWVAFSSFASNLVAGDTNGTWDVFVRDTVLRQTSRVSVNSFNVEGNSRSTAPAISSNGRFVAFESAATNLVFGDTNRWDDIFLHDRDSGVTTRASVGNDSTQANSSSHRPAFSADGRFLAFESHATNLVANDTNDRRDIFVRVIPEGNIPTAPSNLSALVRGSTVTFTWTAPAAGAPPARYVLAVSRSPRATDFELATTGAATTFDATNVPAGTYYARVHGENDFGLGPPSNEIVGSATALGATVRSGTYYVRVRGRNHYGVSGPSNEVTITVP
jgi:Tol biopolymer transport system component